MPSKALDADASTIWAPRSDTGSAQACNDLFAAQCRIVYASPFPVAGTAVKELTKVQGVADVVIPSSNGYGGGGKEACPKQVRCADTGSASDVQDVCVRVTPEPRADGETLESILFPIDEDDYVYGTAQRAIIIQQMLASYEDEADQAFKVVLGNSIRAAICDYTTLRVQQASQ